MRIVSMIFVIIIEKSSNRKNAKLVVVVGRVSNINT